MEIRKLDSENMTMQWDIDVKCQPKVSTYELGDDSSKWYYRDLFITGLPLENCWSSIYGKHMTNYIKYNETKKTIKGK